MSQLDLFGKASNSNAASAQSISKLQSSSDAELRRSMDYQKHIKSAQWSETREALFKLRGKKCEICGATTNLELHHLTYERFGKELPRDLKILCKPHHEQEDRAREAEQQRQFEERCEETRCSNARHTYMTKKYGEDYHPTEAMEYDYQEWKERKQMDEYFGGGDSGY